MHFEETRNFYDSCIKGYLHNRHNEKILVHHDHQTPLSQLVESGQVDTLIIEPEDGFSQLGMSREYISEQLGLSQRHLTQWVLDGMRPDFESNISSMADWLRSTDPDVTVLGIPSRNRDSALKGLVMVPYEASRCYLRFAQPLYNKPYRDFFYNVTYEALYYAYQVLGARNFAISHLSSMKYGRGGYRMDITKSQVNAVLHFCNEYREVKQVTFWDNDRGNYPIQAMALMTPDIKRSKHRNINRGHEHRMGFDFISLEWPMPDSHKSNTTNSGLAPKRKGKTEVPTPIETNKRQPGTS